MTTRTSHQTRYEQMIDAVGLPSVWSEKLLVSALRQAGLDSSAELLKSDEWVSNPPPEARKYLNDFELLLAADKTLLPPSTEVQLEKMHCELLKYDFKFILLTTEEEVRTISSTLRSFIDATDRLIALGVSYFWSERGEAHLERVFDDPENPGEFISYAEVRKRGYFSHSQTGLRFFKRVFESRVFEALGKEPKLSPREQAVSLTNFSDAEYIAFMLIPELVIHEKSQTKARRLLRVSKDCSIVEEQSPLILHSCLKFDPELTKGFLYEYINPGVTKELKSKLLTALLSSFDLTEEEYYMCNRCEHLIDELKFVWIETKEQLLDLVGSIEIYAKCSDKFIDVDSKDFWADIPIESFGMTQADGGDEWFVVDEFGFRGDGTVSLKRFQRIFELRVLQRLGHKPLPSPRQSFFYRYNLLACQYIECMQLPECDVNILRFHNTSDEPVLFAQIRGLRQARNAFQQVIDMGYTDYYSAEVQGLYRLFTKNWLISAEEAAHCCKQHEALFNSLLLTEGSRKYSDFYAQTREFLKEYFVTHLQEVECFMSPGFDFLVNSNFDWTAKELLECVRFPELVAVVNAITGTEVSKDEFLKLIRPMAPACSSRLARF